MKASPKVCSACLKQLTEDSPPIAWQTMGFCSIACVCKGSNKLKQIQLISPFFLLLFFQVDTKIDLKNVPIVMKIFQHHAIEEFGRRLAM
jgi:hypothetical protein